MVNTKKINKLRKKSSDAIKVVTNMMASLEEANKQVRFERAGKLETKAKIEEEIAALDTIEEQNENFVKKFNKLFED